MTFVHFIQISGFILPHCREVQAHVREGLGILSLVAELSPYVDLAEGEDGRSLRAMPVAH